MHVPNRMALARLSGLVLAAAVAAACAGERADEAVEEGTQEAASAAFSVERTLGDVRTPESVRPGPDGLYYVSEIGEFGTNGDGRILTYDPATWESSVFAEGLDDPKGMIFRDDVLYVTDIDHIVGLTAEGVQTVIGPDAFPEPPTFLNDLVVGPDGALYVSDSGEFEAVDGAIYRIEADGGVEPVITHEDTPEIASPNGLTFDPEGNLLTVDLNTGKLMRVEETGVTVLAEGFGGGDGLEFAPDGTLYVTDFQGGRVLRVSFGGAEGPQVETVAQVASAADLGLDARRGRLVIPQLMENTLTVVRLP